MRNLLAPKEPILTSNQFDRLSNIFDNAGQIVFGITVVAPFFSKNSINPQFFVTGAIIVIFSWSASLWIAKRGENL